MRKLALATLTATLALTACSSDHDDEPAKSSSPSAAASRSTSTTSASPNVSDYTQPGADLPAGKNGTPRGAWPAVKDTDAQSVAIAHQTAAFAVDTRIDNSYRDAIRRAAKLETPQLARTNAQQAPALDGEFNNLMEAKGYREARCTYTPLEGQAKATDTTAQLTITCVLTDHGGAMDGQSQNQEAIVNLTRGDKHAAWRVSSTQYIATN